MIVQGTALQIKEYRGKRVVTFKDIDTVHKRPDGTARRNFNQNRQRFISGVDFFKVCADEIRTHKIAEISPKSHEPLTLITETGYLMLVKSFTDDLALGCRGNWLWGAEGTIDNEPWFVGKDVATALGYKNTKDALATHIESCDKIMGSQNATPSITDSMGRTQHPTWINESGLYATFTDFQNKQMLKNDLEFRVSLTRACVGTYKGVMLMEYIEIKQFKEKVPPDAKSATFQTKEGKENTVYFGYQKTGYGKKRFFLCPCCGKRVTKLYSMRYGYRCRECGGINPYEGIKNMTKGGSDEITYRMLKYGTKHGIQFEFPFDYLQFATDERIRKKSFLKSLKILQGLENMRFQAIMNKTTYSANLLSSVCKGKHLLLQEKSLYDLKNWIYNWNTGQEIIVPHPKLFIK